VVLILIVWAWDHQRPRLSPASTLSTTPSPVSPGLTRQDVLPTPTVDFTVPQRVITFPGPGIFAPIVEALRVPGGWEMRNLGDSVGHLQGTAWIDDPQGNIVLTGHVENALGEPGPFAPLSQAKVGDRIILSEGGVQKWYEVVAVEQAAPDDLHYLTQNSDPRLTLITCAAWDVETQSYLKRLVVIAKPLSS
jgi:LPXTG-site transpeptidase (sortase) family protein